MICFLTASSTLPLLFKPKQRIQTSTISTHERLFIVILDGNLFIVCSFCHLSDLLCLCSRLLFLQCFDTLLRTIGSNEVSKMRLSNEETHSLRNKRHRRLITACIGFQRRHSVGRCSRRRVSDSFCFAICCTRSCSCGPSREVAC